MIISPNFLRENQADRLEIHSEYKKRSYLQDVYII